MSKAEKLLQRIVDNSLSEIQHNGEPHFGYINTHLFSDIQTYLNREEKLVVGSEWVCDIDNSSLEGSWIPTGRVVTIDRRNDYDKLIIVKMNGCFFYFKNKQFLACFSPKENE